MRIHDNDGHSARYRSARSQERLGPARVQCDTRVGHHTNLPTQIYAFRLHGHIPRVRKAALLGPGALCSPGESWSRPPVAHRIVGTNGADILGAPTLVASIHRERRAATAAGWPSSTKVQQENLSATLAAFWLRYSGQATVADAADWTRKSR